MFKKTDKSKKDSGAHSLKAAPDVEEDPARRARKLRIRLILALSALALVVLALILLPMFSRGGGGSMTAVETVVSGEAAVGDISQVFSGSGTLTDQEAEDIELPETVEVLGFTVRNGETVSKGDALAQVDKASVMRAIAELQETIDQIDEDMETAAADMVTSTLTAPADGRIMAVYAEKGDSVLDVMYDHSALMLISLDGLVAVDVADSSLSVGARPTVRLSDGTELAGRVDALNNGVATVTFSDEGVSSGDTAAVLDADGKELGGGAVYIHSELKLTGFSGTVSELYVFAGSQVTEGQSLVLLEDTDYAGDYMKLLSQREKYTQQMDLLFETYQDGYVHAQLDGIVTGIEAGAKYISLSSSGSADGVVLLRNIVTEGKAELTLLSSATTPAITYAKYAGKLTAVSGTTLTASINPTAVSMSTDVSALSTMDASLFTQSASGDFANAVVYIYQSGTGGGGSSLAAGDLVLLTVKTETDSSVSPPVAVTSITQIDCLHSSGQQGGGMGGTGGGMTGSGGTTTATTEEETQQEKENVLCGIIPGEAMTVVISVDELDVLSLKVGQSAVVSLDAISGRSCNGIVTAIDPVGVNNGGSTKYSMTISIERTEDMLSGMNASARIEVGNTPGVLTIPVAAVFEDGSRSYVYTGYDEKNDQLSSPVEVTLGVSDGENVEVLSGMSAGDRYYYRYADTLTYSFG